MDRTRVVIMGAAGRDFHGLQRRLSQRPGHRGRGVHGGDSDPRDAGRRYPAELPGRSIRRYPDRCESELERLLAKERIDLVVFAYSDVAPSTSCTRPAGTRRRRRFELLGRTGRCCEHQAARRDGCHPDRGWQEPTTRYLAALLEKQGLKVVSCAIPCRTAISSPSGSSATPPTPTRPLRNHDRRARGVQPHRMRSRPLRRSRLRGHPSPGGDRG